MFIRKAILLLSVVGACHSQAHAQSGDFCEAVTVILNDANNQFRNIKGKQTANNMNAIVWDCGIKVPGVISARFVSSMGQFYEGAVFQSKTIDGLKAAYEQYKAKLKDCFGPKGYVMSLQDNFYPGLAAYKKVVFMLDDKTETAPNAKLYVPPHIALEATYNKDAGYTLVMFVYNH